MGHVIVRLMGGLGNQMFQYATGLALARRLNVPLLLDREFLDSRPTGMNWTARSLELDVFKAPLHFADREVVEHARHELESLWSRRLERLLPGLLPKRCYLQQGTGYDPGLLHCKAPVHIEGFWQNERYFVHLANELRTELFVPRDSVQGLNAELLDRITSGSCASIHVRRGDYVSNAESNQYHGVCPPEYYLKAADQFVREQGVEHFFLFSDEPDWVKANLPLPYPLTIVSHNTGRNSHWDLHLMRHCKHHIIANSSFSWWGAWLNADPQKVVIAPAQWFQGNATPASDILPPEWIAR